MRGAKVQPFFEFAKLFAKIVPNLLESRGYYYLSKIPFEIPFRIRTNHLAFCGRNVRK